MSHDAHDEPPHTNEPEADDLRARRIRDEAARLGLAIVGQATAMASGDPDDVVASEENLRDVVDDLIDDPLTDRQEEVVAVLGAMSGSIAAGLAGALGQEQDREPHAVLGDAAGSIIRQQELAAAMDTLADRGFDDHDPDTAADGGTEADDAPDRHGPATGH